MLVTLLKSAIESFTDLRNEISTGDFDRSIYDFLMSRNIKNKNFKEDRVNTNFYKELKDNSIPIIARFLDDFTIKNKGDITKYADKFFKLFCDWKAENKFNSFEINSTSFGRDLKSYNGVKKKRSNKGIIYNIDSDEVIKYLKEKKYIDEDECLFNSDSDSDDKLL